jgi:hypothetical protein
LAGCGGTYNASVTGKVTLDGTPVPRGTVTFYPVTTGSTAYGKIESDGSYELRTGKEAGLNAGDYVVTIAANEPPTEKRGKGGGPPPPGKEITPAWYRDRNLSDQKHTIETGKNEINLELTSNPPPGWKPPRARNRR